MDMSIIIAEDLRASIIRQRFAVSDGEAVIQRKYCEQWISNSLAHAKTSQQCKDAISRLCRPLTSMAFVGEIESGLLREVQEVGCMVAPPKLSIDADERDLIKAAYACLSCPEGAGAGLPSVFHKLPNMRKSLLGELEIPHRDFTQAASWVDEISQMGDKIQAVQKVASFDERLDKARCLLYTYYDPACANIRTMYMESHAALETERARHEDALVLQLETSAVEAWVSLMKDIISGTPPSSEQHAQDRVGQLSKFVDILRMTSREIQSKYAGYYLKWAQFHQAGIFAGGKVVADIKVSDANLVLEMVEHALRIADGGGEASEQENALAQWCKDVARPALLEAIHASRIGPLQKMAQTVALCYKYLAAVLGAITDQGGDEDLPALQKQALVLGGIHQ